MLIRGPDALDDQGDGRLGRLVADLLRDGLAELGLLDGSLQLRGVRALDADQHVARRGLGRRGDVRELGRQLRRRPRRRRDRREGRSRLGRRRRRGTRGDLSADRVHRRVEDQALVLLLPRAVERVVADDHGVPGAGRRVDDRRASGEAGGVRLVAVVARIGGDGGRVLHDLLAGADQRRVKHRVCVAVAVDPAAEVEAPGDGVGGVEVRVERGARRQQLRDRGRRRGRREGGRRGRGGPRHVDGRQVRADRGRAVGVRAHVGPAAVDEGPDRRAGGVDREHAHRIGRACVDRVARVDERRELLAHQLAVRQVGARDRDDQARRELVLDRQREQRGAEAAAAGDGAVPDARARDQRVRRDRGRVRVEPDLRHRHPEVRDRVVRQAAHGCVARRRERGQVGLARQRGAVHERGTGVELRAARGEGGLRAVHVDALRQQVSGEGDALHRVRVEGVDRATRAGVVPNDALSISVIWIPGDIGFVRKPEPDETAVERVGPGDDVVVVAVRDPGVLLEQGVDPVLGALVERNPEGPGRQRGARRRRT